MGRGRTPSLHAGTRVRLSLGALGLVVLVGCGPGAAPLEPATAAAGYNCVAGTQTALSVYQFSDQTLLVETARGIRAMGSNTLKLAMSARYCGVEYRLPADGRIVSLRTLAELEPSFRQVFAMDFGSYLIWAYSFSQFSDRGQSGLVSFYDGLSEHEAEQVYAEVYDLARYFLTTFSGSHKVFYIGHWEGDWHLRPDFDRERALDERAVEAMIAWLRVRQRAVDDAKRDTPHRDVEVYHYSEVNLVQRGMNGQDVLATRVLPEVAVDYVSYSAWDSTNSPRSAAEMRRALFAALDFIEGQLQPRPGLPDGKRVWIGEFGYPEVRFSQDEADLRSRWVLRAGIEWGCPFVLYWEFYNNELEDDGTQRGYWLIDDTGEQTRLYATYAAYFQEAQSYVSDVVRREQRLPTRAEFAAAALGFASLDPDPRPR